jgi:hypothetical protein
MLRRIVGLSVAMLGLATVANAQQVTTVYNLGSGVCVHSTNCTIYANNETQSLWWDYTSGTTGFVIFELASWDPTYHATNEYVCGDPYITPGGSIGIQSFSGAGGTCSNVDSNGLPFTMTYSFQVTPYTVRVGSGRGGGGVGVRYRITGLTVAITQ